MRAADRPFVLELSQLAREVLVEGLWQVEGPWSPGDDLARLLGFADAAHLRTDVSRLRSAIERAEPLSFRDWWRALSCTETVALTFALGVRSDWQSATGVEDVDALTALAEVERALHRAVDHEPTN